MQQPQPAPSAEPGVRRSVPAAARRRYVDLPWGQVHVTTSGQGPPLVLLHSLPRSGEEFRDVTGVVSGRSCYAIDLPGFGASDALPGAPSIEEWAQALWAICAALDLSELDVVGHHGGGVLALEMAASRPQSVRSLLLSSTPWLGPQERRERRESGTYYGFEPVDDLSHLLKMAERRRRWMPSGRPELWNPLVVDVLRARDPEAALGALMNYRMEERIALVRCPSLVLARRGDIWFSQREVMASHLADATLEIIDGTVLVEDTAALLVQAIHALLARAPVPALS